MLLLAVVLPIITIILSIITIFFNLYGDIYDLSLTLIFAIIVESTLGSIRGHFIHERKRFIARFLPAFLLMFYFLLIWLMMIVVADGNFGSSIFYSGQRCFGIFYSVLMGSASMTEFYTNTLMEVIAPIIPFGGILAYIVMCFITVRRRDMLGSMAGWRGIVLFITALALAISGLLAWQTYDNNQRRVVKDPAKEITEYLELGAYFPFTPDNKLTTLSSPATLSVENNWPRLDGATAVYPVYASAAQALYHHLDAGSVKKYVSCERTSGAYDALLHDQADIIFVAEPSAEQKASARAQGIYLHFYPVAREAFVFVTHKDNPVTQLDDSQIRDIYSGRVNNWCDVGGNCARIYPYQRPQGSGSQTIMLAAVMGEDKLRKPLETESFNDMPGLLRRVTNYQNSANSLGYTFRYYATQLHSNTDLRLLSLGNAWAFPALCNLRILCRFSWNVLLGVAFVD